MRDEIERAWSPMAAWIELRAFFEACVKNDRIDKARRIMDYARYCLAAPHADINTAAAVGFIEHLADHEQVRLRLPEFMTAREVEEWRTILTYHTEAVIVDALSESCRGQRRQSHSPIKKAGQ
ncbi:hypothetical protein GGQ73_000582 [Rhizobium skierniewicense]|uniref:DUF7674 domain-containing protein n=1 Tax=Rhizobium skierniewicense TaxID=984260 RepID=A0A7W6C7K3_9HYPH|nr:hypothetical protein [Rhizobium skierniewicense]MBB3944657.1 hypothetical protein [Rhizobium skierniewicense]